MRLVRTLIALAALVLLVPSSASASRLVQLPSPNGCVLNIVVAGCAQAPIGNPSDIIARGNQVYVSSASDNTIRIFDRDPVTGALTPRVANANGCISDAGLPCADAKAFIGPGRMAFSPDGSRLYVLLTQGIAVLKRDPSTGALSQSSSVNACVTQSGSGGECAISPPMAQPMGLAAYGENVYVAGQAASNNGFVTVLDVVSGGLQQHTISSGSGACAENVVVTANCLDARALSNGRIPAVPPDGGNVYVTGTTSNSISVFKRNADGSLALVAGEDGCLQDVTINNDGCRTTGLLGAEAFPIVFSSDTTGYVGGVSGSYVTQLIRNPTTGGLETAAGHCAASRTDGEYAACAQFANNMFGIVDFELTPDRSELLVGARFGRGITDVALAANGSPVPVAPPDGCIATGGIGFTSPCQLPTGFARVTLQDFGPNGIALSEDGKFVYGASPQNAEDRAGIVAARRDIGGPTCQSATVSVTAGKQVTLPLACTDPDGDPIARTIVKPPAHGATGPVDQTAGTVPFTAPNAAGTETLTFKGTALGLDSPPATVTIHVIPSNEFSFVGKPKLNKKKGTATITVLLPGPGALTLSGKGVKPATKTANSAGKQTLTLKATGKAAKTLRRTGKVKLKAKVTFTPTGGTPASKTKAVKLIKKRR